MTITAGWAEQQIAQGRLQQIREDYVKKIDSTAAGAQVKAVENAWCEGLGNRLSELPYRLYVGLLDCVKKI